MSEGICKRGSGFSNAIRNRRWTESIGYSEELSADAQCKSTYTGVICPKTRSAIQIRHFPPQLDGLSDEYYAKCQSGSWRKSVYVRHSQHKHHLSISNALDDSYGTGQYYSRGHRYNLLESVKWKYIGVGNTLQQGCHKNDRNTGL